MRAWSTVRVGAQNPNRTNCKLERTLHFCAITFRRIELVREEDRLQRLANVTVALRKRGRDAIDQCRRRIVRNKVAHQLGRDELRRRRMMRENVEHLQTVVETATGGNLLTEHNFLAVVVRAD